MHMHKTWDITFLLCTSMHVQFHRDRCGHICICVAQCISNLHTKCATHTCLHANWPPLALNSDFNEQVLGRGTKGIKQLISPDCRQPCSSELDGAGGIHLYYPPCSLGRYLCITLCLITQIPLE